MCKVPKKSGSWWAFWALEVGLPFVHCAPFSAKKRQILSYWLVMLSGYQWLILKQ